MPKPRDVIDEYHALGERFQRLPRWAAALMATMAGEIVRLRNGANGANGGDAVDPLMTPLDDSRIKKMIDETASVWER